MASIRTPAVAGQFYPADPQQLRTQVQTLLADAEPEPISQQPKALIVPHAGYIYSGATAAAAYALLKPWRSSITRVVLLGPSHHVPLRGLAAPPWDDFASPLGLIPLDREALNQLSDLPQVLVSDQPHLWEHALEVQLPFLQCVLDSFQLVPLVVGQADADTVSEVLDRLWGGAETLIVVSSDLSHFLTDSQARPTDQHTAQTILTLEASLRGEQACGAMPINGLLRSARRHHLEPHCLELCNSGRTTGDLHRVVGYGAFVFIPDGQHGTLRGPP